MTRVSPGFTPRPSLSDRRRRHGRGCGRRVAGVHAPAFVERIWGSMADKLAKLAPVSPGFTPRPSLSVGRAVEQLGEPVERVSPGFTPRPSLSDQQAPRHPCGSAGVAGVHAPAFVERSSARSARNASTRVSPGFTPRPSLSGRDGRQRHRVRARVAGVHAPAFVERGRGRPPAACARWCRRGSRPGLR